mmetsp:Transcript_18492/g.33110  ORF Transcript_18492/g.33110 Transcript_18492/m.33110 type:complete len:492 (-) Transcript_18492:62-1537(-)
MAGPAQESPEFVEFCKMAERLASAPLDKTFLLDTWTGAHEDMICALKRIMDTTADNQVSDRHGGPTYSVASTDCTGSAVSSEKSSNSAPEWGAHALEETTIMKGNAVYGNPNLAGFRLLDAFKPMRTPVRDESPMPAPVRPLPGPEWGAHALEETEIMKSNAGYSNFNPAGIRLLDAVKPDGGYPSSGGGYYTSPMPAPVRFEAKDGTKMMKSEASCARKFVYEILLFVIGCLPWLLLALCAMPWTLFAIIWYYCRSVEVFQGALFLPVSICALLNFVLFSGYLFWRQQQLVAHVAAWQWTLLTYLICLSLVGCFRGYLQQRYGPGAAETKKYDIQLLSFLGVYIRKRGNAAAWVYPVLTAAPTCLIWIIVNLRGQAQEVYCKPDAQGRLAFDTSLCRLPGFPAILASVGGQLFALYGVMKAFAAFMVLMDPKAEGTLSLLNEWKEKDDEYKGRGYEEGLRYEAIPEGEEYDPIHGLMMSQESYPAGCRGP